MYSGLGIEEPSKLIYVLHNSLLNIYEFFLFNL